MASIIPGSSIFRKILVGEGVLNAAVGASMVLAPRLAFADLFKPGQPVSPGIVQLAQWFGVLLVASSVPLFRAYPNTTEGVANRKTAYLQLGVIEIALSAVALTQRLTGNSEFEDTSLAVVVVGMLGSLGWRIYSGIVNPEVMGYVTESETKKTQ